MIDTLTILAPGLLGGSVAMAARELSAARRIVIWARRPEVRLQVEKQPWCDAVESTPELAVRNADLVVLAAPVEKITELAQRIAPHLKQGCIVTDVGSTKGALSRACTAALGHHARFVGSHPMAGSEKTGWENASAELFRGRVCFVTPLPATDGSAVEIVARFWSDLGARVTTLPPDEHDEIVAHISHLPQVLATSLCTFLGQRPPQWRNFSGGGLRDTTRIAASDASMWVEILRNNREEVLRALRGLQSEFEGFHAALANSDWLEIQARLERGKAYRDAFRP
ncbi:MAG: prephenate dehydrogenase/arogenate dehydrogenase family protein [Opitutaceae bacterium]|nr:prephenate dehydrogenase/arogenate dehydrogenase family protein [Opitutaceae bacterium]